MTSGHTPDETGGRPWFAWWLGLLAFTWGAIALEFAPNARWLPVITAASAVAVRLYAGRRRD